MLTKNDCLLLLVEIGNKGIDTKDYVLGKFSKEESDVLTNIYSKLGNITYDFVELDSDKLKQKYNSMNK